MARQFDDADSITCAAGGLANSTRAGTTLILVRPFRIAFSVLATNADFISGYSGTTGVWSVFDDGQTVFSDSDNGAGSSVSLSNLNTWYVVAMTKASGTATIRYHVATVGGAWTHNNSGTVANGPGGTDSIKFGIGYVENRAGFEIAAAARWKTAALSDVEIEALGTTDMADWLAGNPDGAWQFNQTSTSDAVTDLTAGGADQTAISGTAVVSDPAGWSYSTGGGGASVSPSGVSVPVALGSPTTAVQATAAPDGISVPVGLGSPTGSVQVTATPDGIAVPVALGSPTLAWSASVAPDGIAVPVSPGSPTVGAAGLVPDGVAVPVTLGSPTLVWSATVAPDGIAVPVALGSPAVGVAPVAPDGISVPVTLGSPTLAWSGVVAPGGVSVPVALGNPTASIPGAVIHRPNTGTVTRPDTGIVARPNTGTVSRP